MHQFNKGTRKDKDGKGTGNHKNDIVFKEVENSFGNMDRCLKVLLATFTHRWKKIK